MDRPFPTVGRRPAFGSYGRVMTGYFQMLNEKGGINGRKINLISLDNAFSPAASAADRPW